MAILTLTIVLIVFVPVTLALITVVTNARSITAEIKAIESIPYQHRHHGWDRCLWPGRDRRRPGAGSWPSIPSSARPP